MITPDFLLHHKVHVAASEGVASAEDTGDHHHQGAQAAVHDYLGENHCEMGQEETSSTYHPPECLPALVSVLITAHVRVAEMVPELGQLQILHTHHHMLLLHLRLQISARAGQWCTSRRDPRMNMLRSLVTQNRPTRYHVFVKVCEI